MTIARYFVYLLIFASFTSSIIYAQDRRGQETSFDRELNTRDDQPVKEFVQSKENIDVKEKASNMEISGDVRFEWRSIREKGVVYYVERVREGEEGSTHKQYRALRGGDHVDGKGIPLSMNDFDVEFNFKIKYNFEDAWAAAHVQFDNPAGIKGRNDCVGRFPIFNHDGSKVIRDVPRNSRLTIKGSGEGVFINLKRAYMGYNIWADGKHRFDIEVGRRKFDDIFDSEIQFSSRFDGILLKFATSLEDYADFYWNGGAFVIDERVNHFGGATEIGFLNIMDSSVDFRYNFIDWKQHKHNRCFAKPLGTRFQNSQVSLAYTIYPEIFCKETSVEFYGGFLVNHAAKKIKETHGKLKNLGWYAGVYVGNPHKKGDWSIDIEYIGVQAQAISEYDVGSIGRGNVLDENSLDEVFDLNSSSGSSRHNSYSSSSGVVGIFPGRGNTNFVGCRFEFLYLFTDNLSIDLIYEFSNAEDRHIGGKHHYDDFEIEAIYAF